MSELKNKKGIIVGVILIVLLLIMGITFLLMPVKPKKVFETAINSMTTLSKKDLKENVNISLNTNIHSNDKDIEKVLELVNNIKMNINYNVDFNNKKMDMVMDSTYQDKELINLSMNVDNNLAYVYLKDVYDKYIEMPFENNEVFNMEDYEIVLKELNSALNKSLKEEYFKKVNTSIIVNDKSVKVIDNQLVLNNTNIKEIATNLNNELNNDAFRKSFSKLFGLTEEEVKTLFTELQNANLEEDVTISIYTKGKELVGIGIKSNNEVITIIKNSDTSLKINLDIEEINGTINVDVKESNKVNISDVDKNNVIKIDDISNEDGLKIMTNLQKKEGVALLIKTLSSSYSSMLNF